MLKDKNSKIESGMVFIDLFAGCGGFSLGLIEAGWKGLFAIEKDPMAFKTLRHNLIDGKRKGFKWPKWLEKEAMPISRLLTKHREKLHCLRGKVDLIVGGPPCQGFSLVGRRNKNDPRNKLTREYIKVVKEISPRYLLLENVKGFDLAFSEKYRRSKNKSYAKYVQENLKKLGYMVYSQHLRCSDYGVPQHRSRFILIAIKKGDHALERLGDQTPFDMLLKFRKKYLKSKGLNPNKAITVQNALSDLKTNNKWLIPYEDSYKNNFFQIEYKLPKKLSAYKKIMRKGMVNGSPPSDLRLPNHKQDTINKFIDILDMCEKGKSLSLEDKEELELKKQALTPLSPSKPAATVTTLPDDILHYSEPRILTVRENARLQSFPDWFSFQGNYTTGGLMRKKECPRYTQVGNAVPPLLSEALGKLFITLLN